MKYCLIFSYLFLNIGFLTSQNFNLLPAIIYNSSNQKYSKGFDGGLNSSQFSMSDLNLDGIDELVIYQRNAKNWLIYSFNPVLKQYQLDYNMSISMPYLNQDIAILRDYDCDGKEDLFVNESDNLAVWKNISTSSEIEFERKGVLKNGFTDIYNRSYDLPGIEDVDLDGDIDILCYGINGTYLEYYKNMSIEMYGICDSLVYELANECWGHFTEDITSPSLQLLLLDTCFSNVSNPQKSKLHTGSTITVLDYDGDGVKDMLIGGLGYSNLVYAENHGNQVNQNSSLINADYNFPPETIPVNMDQFPAGYWIDVNQDGIEDLVISPNIDYGSNTENATWYYQNYGSISNPVLNQITTAFLQGEMLDLGSFSNISITDFNSDGKSDIALSCHNTYSNSGNNNGSKITMLENITQGDTLKFITIEDYGELYNLNRNAIAHSIEDIDADGYTDILFGDESGQIHLAKQDQNGLFSYSFSLANSNGRIIDVGQFSTPQLLDYDGDGDFDLAIGNRYGKIAYYQNIGNEFNFSFDSITSDMGGVNVLRDMANGGYAKPYFSKNTSGNWNLWVGSYTGQNYRYSNIEGNITNSFDLLDSIDFKFGKSTSVALFPFNGDTCFVLGSARGGLSIFNEYDISLSNNYGLNNQSDNVKLKHLKNSFEIECKEPIQFVKMYNILGQSFGFFNAIGENIVRINHENYPRGIYIIQIKTTNYLESLKVIVSD